MNTIEVATPAKTCQTLFVDSRSIPDDHHRQTHSRELLAVALKQIAVLKSPVVLDLGCGSGGSVDFIRSAAPGCRWIGVDIAESPEVDSRKRTDVEFFTFDGVNIPCDEASIDLVYCNQAITHAADPFALLQNVRRILKPTGQFIGSCSHMEPIMSYMRASITPYGFEQMLNAAGLQLIELRPGIDAITLILRRFTARHRFFNRFFETESPLNRLINIAGKRRRQSARQINTRKLLFSGQYSFRAAINQ